MPRSAGLGRLSYRGILALGIGLVFIWFALHPGHFNDDVPPIFIRLIMLVSGAGLVCVGIASVLFVWRRSQTVRSQSPVAAEICVLEDDDLDRSTETVHVRINGRCQALGVDRSDGVVHKYLDGKVRRGDVWLNEKGMVHAVSISGEHFNTLIGGRTIPDDCFGKSEKAHRC